MDQEELKQKITQFISKYKFVILVLMVGIVLMSLPTPSQKEISSEVTAPGEEPNLTEDLEQILSQMEGVGKVRVLITEGDGARTNYQTDEDRSADGSIRIDTVIVSGSDRGQTGLVQSVTPPVYLGAIVVCQGADRPAVRFEVVQAVSNVTGISSDRITVVKMK